MLIRLSPAACVIDVLVSNALVQTMNAKSRDSLLLSDQQL
jgi:hypothetical protein